MKLSPGEKLSLLMLCDISKRVGGQPGIDPNFIEQTIYADQLWGLDWEFTGIPYEREQTPKAVSETVDILDMFSLSTAHFKGLTSPDQKKVRESLGHSARFLDSFPGFDANHDPHFGIAQYLVQHLKKFKDLPGATNNSHSQSSLPHYRVMLQAYRPLRAKLADRAFTAEELIGIFKAGPKPQDGIVYVSGEDENDD